MKLLETTLRDGSYAVGFKFTPKDTARLASALENIGFDLIEIGHGLGLHAKEAGYGDAASTDAEYLQAAASVLKKAKFGMFCIPGIARLEDIGMAAEYGMKFIRIGTNINELKGTQRYFEEAKKHHMHVSSNLMKSYVVAPKEFGKYTKLAKEYGADVAVLVDSAGGLFPKDIEAYFRCSKEICDIDLGFHGHNNLGFANANTLKAAEMGAAIVDTSLKGIGRSAGNAVTEMMVLALKKNGFDLGIDEFSLMDFSEKYISPLIHNIKNTPISITTGYAQFHSSFLDTVLKYAEKYHVDPRELIIRLTEKDKVHAPDHLLEKLASAISKEKDQLKSRRLFFDQFIEKKPSTSVLNAENQIQTMVGRIRTESKKKGKKTILNLVLSDNDKQENFISEFIQETPLYITGSIELYQLDFIQPLLPNVLKKFDYILLDVSIKKAEDIAILESLSKYFKDENLLLYNDIEVWSKTIVSVVTSLLGLIVNQKILLCGSNDLSECLMAHFKLLGADAKLFVPGHESDRQLKELENKKFYRECKIIIACDRKVKLKRDLVKNFDNLSHVIDAKIDSIDIKCMAYLHKKNVKMIRPDMRAAIAGEIFQQITNRKLINKDLGKRKIKNYYIISGGLIGAQGDIIVDSISSPRRVIGIAEGNGRVRYRLSASEEKKVNEIQYYIESQIE
jgi:4-hydroxy 2-oxovalerate aldolase